MPRASEKVSQAQKKLLVWASSLYYHEQSKTSKLRTRNQEPYYEKSKSKFTISISTYKWQEELIPELKEIRPQPG